MMGEENGGAAGTHVNVGQKERAASLIGGGALVFYGLSRRSWGGLALAIAGSGLVYRGATGYCSLCAALDKKGAQGEIGGKGNLSRQVPGHGGILVEKTVTINKSVEELYRFWHDLENLPRVMSHLERVREMGDARSHWVAKAPMGTTVEWEAQTIRDQENHYIAWRSLAGSTVENSGSVRFLPATGGRGTEVKVIFEYTPPAGALGATVAKLFGEEPGLQVEADLRRFKQLMETGEIPTIEGQPRGAK
jgi:uncharacterized membrane protein